MMKIPLFLIAVCCVILTLMSMKLSVRLSIGDADTSGEHPRLLSPSRHSYEQGYQYALTTIRCLTTPGCFPSVKCRSGSPPTKVRRSKKWEEQSFCTEDLQIASVERQKENAGGKCLVYSFGIHTQTEWEEKVARLFGCEVHAFDPTVNHPKHLAPGVTFHKLGLQGEGTDMSATHGSEYDPIDPSDLLSLNDIMDRLGHAGRTLDVLMMDCEGCEWGVLKQLACGGESAAVDQLVVEAHFSKNLGLHNDADVLIAADAITCLQRERWGITSIEKSGSSHLDAGFARGVAQTVPSPVFLMYLSMQRMPDGDDLPFERMEKIADTVQAMARAKTTFTGKHGKDTERWPSDVQRTWKDINKKVQKSYAQYRKINQPRSGAYDSNERFNETGTIQ